MKFVPPSAFNVDLTRRKKRQADVSHQGIFTLSYEENLIKQLESVREAKRRRNASHPPQSVTLTVPVMQQALTSTRPVSVSEFSTEFEQMPYQLQTEYEEMYRDAPAFDPEGFEELLNEISNNNP